MIFTLAFMRQFGLVVLRNLCGPIPQNMVSWNCRLQDTSCVKEDFDYECSTEVTRERHPPPHTSPVLSLYIFSVSSLL